MEKVETRSSDGRPNRPTGACAASKCAARVDYVAGNLVARLLLRGIRIPTPHDASVTMTHSADAMTNSRKTFGVREPSLRSGLRFKSPRLLATYYRCLSREEKWLARGAPRALTIRTRLSALLSSGANSSPSRG